MADVRIEEKAVAKVAKNYFQRQRPWIVDANLHPCSKNDSPKSSYPSGHATMGYSMAVVLAQAAPEKSQALLARASRYAEHRLVCGMHFRSDIEAGQALGTAVAIRLLADPGFQAEVAAARAELVQAGLSNAAPHEGAR